MKFAFMVLALVFTVTANASMTAYNAANTKLGGVHKVRCATGLTCTATSGLLLITPTSLAATGDVIGDGGDQLFGFLQNQVASTTASLTAAECGSTIVSNSADVMTLPEASTVLGCRYTFVCGTADDLDVNPADATDAIGITGALTPSAGDAIRCTDIGAGFELEAVGANLWSVLKTNGTITDVN